MQNIFVWWYHELFGEFSQHDLFGVCVVCCFSFPKSCCSVCCHFGVARESHRFAGPESLIPSLPLLAPRPLLAIFQSLSTHSTSSRELSFFRSSASKKKTAKHVAQWRKYLKYFSNITRKCSSFKMRNNFHRSVTTTTTGAPTGQRNSYTRNEIRFAFLYVHSLRASLRCSPEFVSYRSVRLL